jgi:type II secretory pathway component PulM
MIGVFIAGGFYWTQDWLNEYAASINANKTASTPTEISPSDLAALQTKLNEQRTAVDKANNITALSGDYNSRTQQDINKYAATTGIKVTDYGPTKAPAKQISTSALVGGVKANYVSVTIQNPVAYNKLIKFINAVETNLPKMRLTGVNISRVENPKGYVNVEPLTIEIYLR